MAVAKSHDKKSPSVDPTEFYRLQNLGTVYGTPGKVSDVLTSGPMREQLMGNPNLSKSMDPSSTTRSGRTGGSSNAGNQGTHPTGPEMHSPGHK